MRTNELMLYKNMEHGRILKNMTFLMENCGNDYYNREDLRSLLFECMNEILEISASHGFEGNLWHTYLTFLLVNDENAYSTSCEIVGEIDGSINRIALHDFQIFKELFDYDFQEMEREFSAECMQILFEYKNTSNAGKVFNRRIRDRICNLAEGLADSSDAIDFKRKMTQFYKEFGVGKFGLHKAFRIDHPEGKTMSVEPITNIAHVHLDDLVGYEIAKKKLIDNTEAFVKGKKANNCLLFGDAGTGKSKFIIYMDDLSFEEFEIEYKYLKAVIEGGLERKPDNVLIYATSNRRHLIRETFRDKADRDEELHTNDTVQEKLSLVARFGVTIYFGSPDKKEFRQIVRTLAQKNKIEMPEEDLLLEANKWELSHGGLSGRTAQQFIDYLMGQN